MADPPEYAVSNRLREMAAGERPQERLERLGPGALSDAELLAMLLRSGTRGQDVMTLAARLLAEAGSLTGLTLTANSVIHFGLKTASGSITAKPYLTAISVANGTATVAAGAGDNSTYNFWIIG